MLIKWKINYSNLSSAVFFHCCILILVFVLLWVYLPYGLMIIEFVWYNNSGVGFRNVQV